MKRHISSLLLLATMIAGMLITSLPSQAQNVIYACITKSTGQIRIVSTTGQCKSNETSISWNITGPQGTQGPVGPQGPEGPQGPVGPPPAPEPSNNETRLLFPYVSNQGGFDTGIAIANTALDPFGTTTAHGTCTIHYYGQMASGGALPAPQTTTDIAAGQLVSFAISQGGVPGATSSAAGFQGYIIAVCNFPLAHAFYFFSDVAASRVGTSGHALVLPSTRTNAVVETRSN